MKKPLVILIFMFFLAMIGLQVLSYQAPSEELVDLQDQFSAYISHDFASTSNFMDYMNDLQFDHVSENVQIHMNNASTTLYQSGIIVKKELSTIYVVSAINYIDVEKNQNIKITDYKNRTYTAQVVITDDSKDLALLTFTTDYYHELNVVTMSEFIPKENEFISSVSSFDNIINYVLTGLFVSQINDSYFQINMDSDVQSIGSSIYDINLNLVGIRVLYDNHIVVVSSTVIQSFLDEHI